MSLGRRLGSSSGFLPLPFSTSTVFYQLSGQREIDPILLFSIHGLYTTLFYQPWARLTIFSNALIISESSSMARTRLFRAALHSLHSQHTSVTFFFRFLGGSLRANFNSLPQRSFHASAYLHSLPIPLISSPLLGNGTGPLRHNFNLYLNFLSAHLTFFRRVWPGNQLYITRCNAAILCYQPLQTISCRPSEGWLTLPPNALGEEDLGGLGAITYRYLVSGFCWATGKVSDPGLCPYGQPFARTWPLAPLQNGNVISQSIVAC
jgi:hypothetical protein